MNKFIFPAGITAICLSFYFYSQHKESRNDLVVGDHLGTANSPVFMAGCQAYHGPVAPKVVYPSVRKNYVSFPCATEVPPTYGTMEMERHNVTNFTN